MSVCLILFQGYNRIIAFSRPFYFCICGSLVLLLDFGATQWSEVAFDLYSLPFTSKAILTFTRDLFVVFMLTFPIIFTWGLLPQVNTFFQYILEQVEMHVFGGNGK